MKTEESKTEIESYDKIEEINILQEYDSNQTIVITLDDLNEKERNKLKAEPMFKRSRQINTSILLISQDYYDLRKKSVRRKGNICHTFKPNTFRHVQNLYQDKASIVMTLNEFKDLTSACWNEKKTTYHY